MDVSVFHPTLNGRGGSEQVCLSVIESLKEGGHDVLLGTFEETRWEAVERYFGKTVRPDMEVVKSRIFRPFAYGEMLNFFSLISAVPENRDVRIISCTSPWCYCPSGKRVIIYLLPPLLHQGLLGQSYLLPYIFMQSQQLHRVKEKFLVTNSSFSARIIQNVFHVNPRVLYPPVNTATFLPLKKEDLVVSIGRFDPLKRYETLIESFKDVKADAQCIIMGSSAGDIAQKSALYLNKLRRMIDRLHLSKKVKLVVNCPFDMLVKTLGKARIYVHCFQNEPFGISVVESMASGCVPMVHRSGGTYHDIIDHDNYGFSFVNANELGAKINFLLERYDVCEEFGKRALERSKSFSKEIFKEKISNYVECAYETR